jgi:hypothetical protein
MSEEGLASRAQKGGTAARTRYGGEYFRHISRLRWKKTKN